VVEGVGLAGASIPANASPRSPDEVAATEGIVLVEAGPATDCAATASTGPAASSPSVLLNVAGALVEAASMQRARTVLAD
jgi:hypothetical protein